MNKIANVINRPGNGKLKFVPSPEFYRTVGIGRKRWAQLLRNEKPANIDELNKVSKYFGVTISDLIEVEQVEL